MKKVLIITYYWPPSGGGGVQRWLKFAKYLPKHNWKPIVIAPENPCYADVDESMLDAIEESTQVIKLPIWEPHTLFNRFSKQKTSDITSGTNTQKKKSIFSKLSFWVRGNIFVPDPRVFWVNPTYRRLKKILPELNPDVIITTGPPHSVHLIGKKLHKKFGTKWIADFRDPWSTIDYLKWFSPSKWAMKRQQKLERQVLEQASSVLTVSKHWAEELKELGAKEVHVITNGYDEDDFIGFEAKKTDKFILLHSGLISPFRNPSALWAKLDELCANNADFAQQFELRLVGSIAKEVKAEIATHTELIKQVKYVDYVPHKELIKEYERASMLLLLTNKSDNALGHIPGKLFEYLATKKAILAFGNKNGDAAQIIRDCKAGEMFEYGDEVDIMSISRDNNTDKVKMYSREKLSASLSELLGQSASK